MAKNGELYKRYVPRADMLREYMHRYMLSRLVSIRRAAVLVGLAYTSLRDFLQGNRTPQVLTLMKIDKFLRKHFEEYPEQVEKHQDRL